MSMKSKDKVHGSYMCDPETVRDFQRHNQEPMQVSSDDSNKICHGVDFI